MSTLPLANSSQRDIGRERTVIDGFQTSASCQQRTSISFNAIENFLFK